MKPPYTWNPSAWDRAPRTAYSPAELACSLERPASKKTWHWVLVWALVAGLSVGALVIWASRSPPY